MTETTATANTHEVIRVGRKDLPLSCPTAGTDQASLHPRVYIPLKQPGKPVVCPYCGAEYVLTD
ncbi:MAG: zinc-finger domain-containing protein [Gammaproteobacteria bacterium]|nr:zinc-finger domain-containing protein [Gammaproteobacteria bacterium]